MYTQDIICHGVPSPKVWRKYKNEIEKKNKSKVNKINFRDKTHGWSNYSLKIDLKNNKTYNELNMNSSYIKCFLANLSLRNSCYDCKFKTKNRKADITLADFWGIKQINRKMYNKNGTSLVIVNSIKGNRLFETIKEGMIFEKVDLNEVINYNSSMILSAKEPKNREEFFENLENKNFEDLVNEYIEKPKFIIKIKGKIKKVLMKLKII